MLFVKKIDWWTSLLHEDVACEETPLCWQDCKKIIKIKIGNNVAFQMECK